MLSETHTYLPKDHPWRELIHYFPVTDSTNLQAKRLALLGAPHGTVVLAGAQTAGRGRMGRTFQSDSGMGVYLSLVLRPHAMPKDLMHLTCAVAVAMCKAIRQCAGFCPDIKWINDLVYEKRKLGGILTELVLQEDTAAIIGIGINCLQAPGDFPCSLQDLAGSLSMFSPQPVEPTRLAVAMIEALYEMDGMLLPGQAAIMEEYRRRCITLHQEVSLLRDGQVLRGYAEDIEEDGALLISFADGHKEAVQSGEVSVRGLYGYF